VSPELSASESEANTSLISLPDGAPDDGGGGPLRLSASSIPLSAFEADSVSPDSMASFSAAIACFIGFASSVPAAPADLAPGF